MTRTWAAAGLLLAIAACATKSNEAEKIAPAQAVEPTKDQERIALRDKARLVLERPCGSCHVSSYETAKPKALAIFDLLEEEWAARMNDAQFTSAMGRLDGPELPGGAPNDLTDDEKKTVAKYFELERSRRAINAGSEASEPASSL